MANPKPKSKANQTSRKHASREYVHRLRGKLKGKGLLEALMKEKKKEGQA